MSSCVPSGPAVGRAASSPLVERRVSGSSLAAPATEKVGGFFLGAPSTREITGLTPDNSQPLGESLGLIPVAQPVFWPTFSLLLLVSGAFPVSAALV